MPGAASAGVGLGAGAEPAGTLPARAATAASAAVEDGMNVGVLSGGERGRRAPRRAGRPSREGLSANERIAERSRVGGQGQTLPAPQMLSVIGRE